MVLNNVSKTFFPDEIKMKNYTHWKQEGMRWNGEYYLFRIFGSFPKSYNQTMKLGYNDHSYNGLQSLTKKIFNYYQSLIIINNHY
jgi:hypothetical protein